MIQVSPQTRILVAVEAVDFRNGIDGLARGCQEQLQADPFSGRLFVFRNRRRTALKTLAYDGRGFWLCQKRLSRGRFGPWIFSKCGAHPRSRSSTTSSPSIIRSATRGR